MSFDPLMPRVAVPIVQRGMYVPEWYTQHTADDLDAVVVRDDGSLPNPQYIFKLREVFPERRWAIGSRLENGSAKMLSQSEFERRFKVWISKGLSSRGEVVDLQSDPDKEGIPTVEDFVMHALDDQGRTVRIGWKPAPTTFSAPRVMYDANGENPMPTLEAVAAGEAEPFDVAPCGKRVKKNYVHAHTKWCKHPACGGDGNEVEAA